MTSARLVLRLRFEDEPDTVHNDIPEVEKICDEFQKVRNMCGILRLSKES